MQYKDESRLDQWETIYTDIVSACKFEKEIEAIVLSKIKWKSYLEILESIAEGDIINRGLGSGACPLCKFHGIDHAWSNKCRVCCLSKINACGGDGSLYSKISNSKDVAIRIPFVREMVRVLTELSDGKSDVAVKLNELSKYSKTARELLPTLEPGDLVEFYEGCIGLVFCNLDKVNTPYSIDSKSIVLIRGHDVVLCKGYLDLGCRKLDGKSVKIGDAQ